MSDVCEWRKYAGSFISECLCECDYWLSKYASNAGGDINGKICPCCKKPIRVIEEEKDG